VTRRITVADTYVYSAGWEAGCVDCGEMADPRFDEEFDAQRWAYKHTCAESTEES
jgi:hypothetical protein